MPNHGCGTTVQALPEKGVVVKIKGEKCKVVFDGASDDRVHVLQIAAVFSLETILHRPGVGTATGNEGLADQIAASAAVRSRPCS